MPSPTSAWHARVAAFRSHRIQNLVCGGDRRAEAQLGRCATEGHGGGARPRTRTRLFFSHGKKPSICRTASASAKVAGCQLNASSFRGSCRPGERARMEEGRVKLGDNSRGWCWIFATADIVMAMTPYPTLQSWQLGKRPRPPSVVPYISICGTI